MNSVLPAQTNIWLSHALKLSALITFGAMALTFAFDDESNLGPLSGLIVFIYLGTYVFPLTLLLMPQKSIQAIGSVLILTLGLFYLDSTISSVLHGDGFGNNFDGFWTSVLSLTVFGTAFISALFLVTTVSTKKNILNQIGIPAAILILIGSGYINSTHGAKITDTFKHWSIATVVASIIVLAIGFTVLAFSDATYATFALMGLSVSVAIYQFIEVRNYFRSANSTSSEFDEYYTSALSSSKPTVMILFKFLCSVIVFLYALYVANFDGAKVISE